MLPRYYSSNDTTDLLHKNGLYPSYGAKWQKSLAYSLSTSSNFGYAAKAQNIYIHVCMSNE